MGISDQQHIIDNFGDGTQWPVEEVINLLSNLDDQYHNSVDNGLVCEDDQYDRIRLISQRLHPHHTYFTGVGSSVRGGKVHLPYQMPSLDQVEVGDIQSWVNKHRLADESFVLSDKMDGTSLMVIYDEDGKLQIAYSRGDGIEGADVTRHVRLMAGVPKELPTKTAAVVRCEVEIAESAFPTVQKVAKSRSGSEYKNPRNCVAGIMNAKSNPPAVYKYLDVFAYTAIYIGNKNVVTLSKSHQFQALAELGFRTPTIAFIKGKDLTDAQLEEYIKLRKSCVDYAIDGVVIDINDPLIRQSLDTGSEYSNPKFSIKYKINDVDNMFLATVTGVEWNVSKDMYLKPTVTFEPFTLLGVTVSRATGFNAKFIVDNGIGPGAEVNVVRSGDVIPYIQSVVKSVDPALPDAEYSWSETGVDIIELDLSDEAEIQRLVNFCTALKLPHLKEGTVRTLYDVGVCKTYEDVINVKLEQLLVHVGTNGIKIREGIDSAMERITLADVIGAVHYTGRGVGSRKAKKLIKALGSDYKKWTHSQIVDVESFDEKTATKIMNGIGEVEKLLNAIALTVEEDVTPTSGPLSNHKICVTGFRDQLLSNKIEMLGGDVQSGVSSKTTILVCLDPESNSGKVKKANDVNASGKGEIKIMTRDAFNDWITGL